MVAIVSRRALVFGTIAVSAVGPAAAQAAEHPVRMLNQHPDDPRLRNVFLPRIVVADPGDTITFLSVQPGHNTQSIDGMIPDGAAPWRSRVSRDFSLSVEMPGIYGYQCTPQVTLGMVGLIIVRGEGMTANLDAARSLRHRGRATMVWQEIWAEVDARNLLA